jgi:TPR repeat protein
MSMPRTLCHSRGTALLAVLVFVSLNLIACNMSSLPRNMNLKAFDPHRADFSCKYEADANPPITREADALFLQGMAATSYELMFPEDKRDYVKAAALWKQAADMGHWKAALNLAGLYERGLGVEEDTEKAVLIVEALMKQGVPAAFDKMGSYHQRGIGVNGDSSRAYGFWQLAADMGSSAAQAFLGEKTSGTYDNPDQGFWGNRAVALEMLECSYAQGNATGAFELGVTLGNRPGKTDRYYARALQILHDAVKFGNSESADYLSSSFRSLEPLTGNKVDADRAQRYSKLGDALERNPDLRLPNLDKVLPLPPAELPSWDGKPGTLTDAAKQLVPERKVPPSAGSQRAGRAHIPQGHGLLEGQLPPMAERQPIPAHHHGRYLVTPQGEQGAVP